MRSFLLATAFCITTAVPAFADPRMEVDATGGSWVSLSWADGMNTTTCAVSRTDASLIFRADANDLEVRVTDPHWSLSSDVHGDVTFKIGSLTKTLHMVTMDEHGMSSIAEADDVSDILTAMQHASSATLIFSAKNQKRISLVGANSVINSFRVCANINGFAKLQEAKADTSTPFQ